ncbi:MAG: hypothetical protein WC714_29080 [Candidatus Obscuribacterales bacterium]|jgi:hypothetical protein
MIQAIMAFFGYVKIPIPVIHLSILQEEFLDRCATYTTEAELKALFTEHLKGQQTLTKFLRSGKLITK